MKIQANPNSIGIECSHKRPGASISADTKIRVKDVINGEVVAG